VTVTTISSTFLEFSENLEKFSKARIIYPISQLEKEEPRRKKFPRFLSMVLQVNGGGIPDKRRPRHSRKVVGLLFLKFSKNLEKLEKARIIYPVSSNSKFDTRLSRLPQINRGALLINRGAVLINGGVLPINGGDDFCACVI
jgi:hypothetical protein